MRAPISVVINDGVTSRHVTKKVRNLRYAKSAYGGDTSLSCDILLPKSAFHDLGPNSTLTVWGADGSEVWSGNIDNPGDSDGPAGEGLQLTAFGGAVRLTYVTEPLAPVETGLDGWVKNRRSNKRSEFTTGERPTGAPTHQHAPRSGANIPDEWLAASGHNTFYEAGLRVGRLVARVGFGASDSWFARVGAGPNPDDTFWDTAIFVGTHSERRASVQFVPIVTVPAGTRANDYSHTGALGECKFPIFQTTAGALADTGANSEKWWVEYYEVILRQQLKTATGAWTTTPGMYDRDYVLAHEVIAHLVGQGMVPGAVGSNASIATTTYQIDALSWLDGINAADALEELSVFEPDLFWTLYGDRFTANLWTNLAPRYVIGEGGIRFDGDEVGTKCNRITVRWVGPNGGDRTTVVRDDTVALTYDRDAETIDLPEGTGSSANASTLR